MDRKVILAGAVFLVLVVAGFSFIWLQEYQILFHTKPVSSDKEDPIRVTYVPGEIPVQINKSIAETTRKLDDIAAIPDTSRTFTNTDARIDEILSAFDEQTLIYSLIADISSDQAVKAEADYATYQRDEFLNSVYLRDDIAHALSVVNPDEGTDAELHYRLTDDFRLASLPADSKSEITLLGRTLSERCSAYLANQRDGNASLNLPLIPEIVSLRQQITVLLGYKSFADYQIEQSGVPVDKNNQISYLYNASAPYSRTSHEEAAELLQEKQKTDPGATAVYDSEIPALRSRIYQVNTSVVSRSAVFPVEKVIEHLNDLVSEIFEIEITPVSSSSGMHVFRITHSRSSETQAWFYLWIKPNIGIGSSSGKTYFLRAGHESDGRWIPPVSALIISVPATQNQEIDLSPVDLQVLFHEYGHLLRHSLSTSRYATLSSGSRDPGGYSEVYSLFLEKFLWTPEGVDRIAEMTGTGDDLSSALRDQMIAGHGEEAGWGPGYIRVYPYFLSLLDLEIHSANGTPDFISQYNRLYENLTGYRAASGPSSLILNPAFFISDNAGIYWHYVLDDACSKEIFSRFQSEGVLNQSTGISCRRELFEPAGSVNTSLLIRNFLGTPDKSGVCF